MNKLTDKKCAACWRYEDELFNGLCCVCLKRNDAKNIKERALTKLINKLKLWMRSLY